ncbi:MAG TPA: VCBS repeat-containing protein, partial [Cyclobacteriaceae bacterium]|nr:VCBS repeat-containing protein [Cyclobacteriaceae bacterium]
MLTGIFSCRHETPPDKYTLFEKLVPGLTNVHFENRLDYKEEFNIYRYRNFYNGGGVALGDINNDSLIDIYFTSNMHANKLYLNKGDFIFEDITERAGVGGMRSWSTGVSLADINADGWLDIYVCNSGDVQGDNKENELFINNRDLTFTESAAEYGIADRGFGTHAAFFDYDKDGDLDLYLLNNSYQAIGSFDLTVNQRNNRDPVGGDKLFRNDDRHYRDVSEEAGIYGSIIGFGLGVTVGDINNDSWQDIYVSNDFFEKDYLYINNQDGTFSEKLEEMMRSISAASMGADMADINNDRFPEIFVTDMLPEHDDRLKTKTTFDSWERYLYGVGNGYYNQFTRNMLHLNNADGTFSEIGRLSKVNATDWSWGALIFDMDNDGWKDIFVANGIYQDLTDQDYIQYFSNVRVMRMIVVEKNVDYKKLIESIPSERIPNYAFHNLTGFSFENKASAWGLDEPSHSNGSAYGDLDNDGDLDIVVNNVNMPAFIYRNRSIESNPESRYLKFVLKGDGKNTEALGTRITAIHQGKTWYIEQMPMRGFQSTVDPRPNLGLGNLEKVDSLVIEWPDGRITLMTEVATNQTLVLSQADAGEAINPFHTKPAIEKIFSELPAENVIDYRHVENPFNDFERDKIIYHMLSTEGPRITKGDINGDGLDDVYIGGAKDSPGALFVQSSNGTFSRTNEALFIADKSSEDADAAFFDVDHDGDQDLYVGSGGYEFPSSSPALIDRLYFNDGKGNLRKSSQILPGGKFENSSCVRPADFDGDGDIELF